MVSLIEKPRHEEVRTKPKKPSSAIDRKLKSGTPVKLDGMRKTVCDLIGKLLRNERPNAKADERASNTTCRRNNRRKNSSVKYFSHLKSARNKRNLYRIVSIDDKYQGQYP